LNTQEPAKLTEFHNPKVGGSNPSPAIGAACKRPFFIALEELITPPDPWWTAHQRLVGNLVGKKLGLIASANTITPGNAAEMAELLRTVT